MENIKKKLKEEARILKNGKWREVLRKTFSRIRSPKNFFFTQIHIEISWESSKTTIDIAPIHTVTSEEIYKMKIDITQIDIETSGEC